MFNLFHFVDRYSTAVSCNNPRSEHRGHHISPPHFFPLLVAGADSSPNRGKHYSLLCRPASTSTRWQSSTFTGTSSDISSLTRPLPIPAVTGVICCLSRLVTSFTTGTREGLGWCHLAWPHIRRFLPQSATTYNLRLGLNSAKNIPKYPRALVEHLGAIELTVTTTLYLADHSLKASREKERIQSNSLRRCRTSTRSWCGTAHVEAMSLSSTNPS